MKKLLPCLLACGLAVGVQARPAKPKATPAPSASPAATASPSPSAAPTPPDPAAPPPKLPPGPLLHSAPNYTSWTVTTTTNLPTSEKSEATPAPKKKKKSEKPATLEKPQDKKLVSVFTGQKAGSVMHTSTPTDNGKEERWSDGKTMVTTNAAWKVPLFSTGTPEEFPKPTWISRKNIKEIKKQGDHEFWIFRDRIFPGGEAATPDAVAPDQNPEDAKVDAVATVDARSRLPVDVQVGNQTITYKFERLPIGEPLEIPYEIRKMISDREFDASSQAADPAAAPSAAPRP